MTKRSIAVEHEGRTYAGEVMRIKSTSLGYEGHGILTAYLHCEANSSGIGVGGYCLDRSLGREGDYKREGTAYGLDQVIRLMETVGVTRWEDIPGKDVIVLTEAKPGQSTLGHMSVGIASLLGDEVLILKDHAANWVARTEAAEVTA